MVSVVRASHVAGLNRWTSVVAVVVAATAVLLWPMHVAGYLLGHDLVFTPSQPLDAGSIGLSSASPRAVPLDALVALTEKIVDGAVVGRIALILPLLGAGIGAAWLLHRTRLPAQLLAAVFAVWNPYVVERLALGQWALLWAYAALPWLAALCAARPTRTVWAGRALLLAAASITPTGGLIALLFSIGLTASSRRSRAEAVWMTLLAVVFQLPWLVPSMVSTASATSDPAAVSAFAARAEHPGGAALSLLGGGGIWNADVVPASRGGVLAWLALGGLVVGAWYGYRRLAGLLGQGPFRGLLAVSVLGFVLAAASSVPGGSWLVREAVAHVPGAGLLRDAQKWIAPLVLLEVLLVSAAVDRLVSRLDDRTWRVLAGVVAVCLPALLLPDAAATLRPTITPVHYSADWRAVDKIVRGGTVAVLPFQSYRQFPWAPGRSVLDPAPRLLDARVIVQDRLAVDGRLLAGEDPRAAAVSDALTEPAKRLASALAGLGVGWVLVERDTPGAVPPLTSLEEVYAGSSLAVYRVPGPFARSSVSSAKKAAVAAADTLAAAAVLAALGAIATGALTSYRHRRRPRATV